MLFAKARVGNPGFGASGFRGSRVWVFRFLRVRPDVLSWESLSMNPNPLQALYAI